MSFKAVFKVEERELNIIYLEFDFFRSLNKNGFPGNYPQSGLLTLFLESSADTFFYDWALSNSQKKSGSIIFFKRDNMSKLKELVFTDAYCVFLKEKFSSSGTNPFYIEIKLSAGELKYGTSVYRNPWFQGTSNDSNDQDESHKESNVYSNKIADKKVVSPANSPVENNRAYENSVVADNSGTAPAHIDNLDPVKTQKEIDDEIKQSIVITAKSKEITHESSIISGVPTKGLEPLNVVKTQKEIDDEIKQSIVITANSREITNEVEVGKKLNNPVLSELKNQVNELDDTLKKEFFDDFADASVSDLEVIQKQGLLPVWSDGLKSSRVDELSKFKSKTGLRDEYIKAVNAISTKAKELENLGKSEEEIAKAVFDLRRKTTTDFKAATPDDLLDVIFKFNDKRYTDTGLGDKWGISWDGVVKKSLKEGKVDYKKIIASAATPLGDKQQLGAGLYKVLGQEALPVIKKYRMAKLISIF